MNQLFVFVMLLPFAGLLGAWAYDARVAGPRRKAEFDRENERRQAMGLPRDSGKLQS